MDQLHTTFVEGTSLLNELASKLANTSVPDAAAVEETATGETEPRFAHEDLNKLAVRVQNAEKIARAETHERTRKVLLDAAVTLHAEIGKVIGVLSNPTRATSQQSRL